MRTRLFDLLRLAFCVCLSLGMCAAIAFDALVGAEFAVVWPYWDVLASVDWHVPVLLGICIGISVALLGFCVRQPRKSPISVAFGLFSGSVVALALSVFGVHYYRAQCAELSRWKCGVACVTSVESKNCSGAGRAIWRFEYTYRVGDVDYDGTYCAPFDLRLYQTGRRNKATGRALKKFVHVFYDPADPRRSRLARWVGVPSSVKTAAAIGTIWFLLMLGYLYRRGIEYVSHLPAGDAIEENRSRQPYALPVLVALGAYLLGTGVFGAFFWNCGDPIFGDGVDWFGRYIACLFGALCATAGSALWPRAILAIRIVIKAKPEFVDVETLIWSKMLAWVKMFLCFPPVIVGFALAQINAVVLLGNGATDQPIEEQFLLFAALGLVAAAVTIGLMLVWCRFSRNMRREIAGRGMTLNRYFGRLTVHLLIVFLLGFVGYELLTWAFCATVLWPFLEQYLTDWLGSVL